MHADDSTLFCASPTVAKLRENLLVESQTIAKWVKINKLKLKLAKAKRTVLSSRDVLAHALNLFVDGISVEQITKLN